MRGELLGFRAHRGWISAVQFLSSPPSESANSIVITSANDKAITLWDINKQDDKTKLPQAIFTTSHIHSSGIYSFHELDTSLLTSSKDSSICLSTIDDAARITKIRTWDECHSGVVKRVRWNLANRNLFTSCGNDYTVCVVDKRQDGGDASIKIENAHNLAVNSVSFHPTNEHLLLSAGFDSIIRLWDTRRPVKADGTPNPLFLLKGHVSPLLKRTSSIYHPCFCGNGKTIVTSGDGSKHLTMFNVETGEMISQGYVGFEASSIVPFKSSSSRLAVAESKFIHFMSPLYSSKSKVENSEMTSS
eukprot:TRINITY_DN8625_c1_g3_i1.p1 TRINITY_DN8625_c1_g3~~TRINITY_DN8625_c1_g3_i1.p1  ORF type:complete len:320 (+),score=58.07 TRINITY_DN8625_c1_g3_i1:54-962(+)